MKFASGFPQWLSKAEDADHSRPFQHWKTRTGRHDLKLDRKPEPQTRQVRCYASVTQIDSGRKKALRHRRKALIFLAPRVAISLYKKSERFCNPNRLVKAPRDRRAVSKRAMVRKSEHDERLRIPEKSCHGAGRFSGTITQTLGMAPQTDPGTTDQPTPPGSGPRTLRSNARGRRTGRGLRWLPTGQWCRRVSTADPRIQPRSRRRWRLSTS